MSKCNCHKDSNGTLVCPEHSKRSYFDHTGDEIMEHINGKLRVSQRGRDWLEFSDAVFAHIENYTVPQYGDKGEDLITGYEVRDCVEHIKKYGKRFGQQSRDGQQELDFMKIAHFAQCAWEKWNNLVTEPETEDGHGYTLIGYDVRLSDDVLVRESLEYMNCQEMGGILYYFYRRTL